MRHLFFSLLIGLTLILQGCSTHPALDDDGYLQYSDSILDKIIKNPNYKRIPIDTNEQVEQYITLEYKVYKKEITKEEFINRLNKSYPGSKESIQWLADQLPK